MTMKEFMDEIIDIPSIRFSSGITIAKEKHFLK